MLGAFQLAREKRQHASAKSAERPQRSDDGDDDEIRGEQGAEKDAAAEYEDPAPGRELVDKPGMQPGAQRTAAAGDRTGEYVRPQPVGNDVLALFEALRSRQVYRVD